MLKIEDKTYVTPCGLVDNIDFLEESGTSYVEPDTEHLFLRSVGAVYLPTRRHIESAVCTVCLART
jgi:hypothetical protein